MRDEQTLMKSIYLDYAATTPVDPRVAAAMSRCLTLDGIFGNPSSDQHSFGLEALGAVDEARRHVAKLLNCGVGDVVFNSGATESDNAALKGVAAATTGKTGHIITMASEHKAVLASCKNLQRLGWEVSYLRPQEDGSLALGDLRAALREDTALVSIMFVNNETGAIQDIAKIRDLLGSSSALLHVDAAQAVGKIPVDLGDLGIDLTSVSAHKMYGPKGAGALIVGDRARRRLSPQMDGGGQEFGLRSGTLATHQIVGFGEACRIAYDESPSDLRHVTALRDRFLGHLHREGTVVINGDLDRSYPGIVSVSYLDIDAVALLHATPGIAASTTSACTSGTPEPSHVLRAMGIEGDRLYGAVRFSFGRFTTPEDVDAAAERLLSELRRLREI